MLEHPQLDYLTRSKFISQPELHPLEMTARMVLVAAALENSRYGHSSDRLLQLYSHNDSSTRAEYKKTLNTTSDRFERIIVDLGRTTLTIALEQGAGDWSGQINIFTDKAVLAQSGNARIAHVNTQNLSEEAFTKASLRQYSSDLQSQLEDFEIILPTASFFAKQ